MLEKYAEWFWIALFFALVLYGVSNVFAVPWRVKRFYSKLNFTDAGTGDFEKKSYSESLLLEGLTTASLYRGEQSGYPVEQFAAHSVQRRKFTLNKMIRKRNQRVWTVTIVKLNNPLPGFCARPMRVPEAPEYVLNNDAVLFPEDEDFPLRMHVVAPEHQPVRDVLNSDVKDFLSGIDPLALESVQPHLILRRPRLPHDSGRQLQQDLDAVVMLAAAFEKNETTVTF